MSNPKMSSKCPASIGINEIVSSLFFNVIHFTFYILLTCLFQPQPLFHHNITPLVLLGRVAAKQSNTDTDRIVILHLLQTTLVAL